MDFNTLADRVRGISTIQHAFDLRRELGPSAEEIAANQARERTMDEILDACQWDVDYPDASAHKARKQYAQLQAQCEHEFYRFYPRKTYGEKSLPVDG